jgi:hypothetical protein
MAGIPCGAMPTSPLSLAWLGPGSLAVAVAAFVILASASSSEGVIAAFWALEAVAAVLALVALLWRGSDVPLWSRGVGVVTLAGQGVFVWVLIRGLSQLT